MINTFPFIYPLFFFLIYSTLSLGFIVHRCIVVWFYEILDMGSERLFFVPFFSPPFQSLGLWDFTGLQAYMGIVYSLVGS